jgi:hypothetical protein
MPKPVGSQTRRFSGNVHVEDLGRKILLLLESEKGSVRSQQELICTLQIGKDLFSRLMSGTRVLSEDKFLKLCEIFDLKREEWHVALSLFGERLGFSRHQIALISGTPIPGIDFASRIDDRDQVNATFNVIAGFWESYYYSVSKISELVVSRDLLIIKRVNEDNFIECEIDDSIFRYTGWCFPTGRHLYFVLEKSKLFDEIIVYTTNRPDRMPPKLYGIILCLSGGVDETNAYPCAAKVIFRYLGSEAAVREHYGLNKKQNVVEALRKSIPGYVSPNDERLDEESQQIIKDISNVVDPSVIPSALRMTK